MPVESLKMTQVKQIQSISNTNRMVLLQAHEVRELYCALMVKRKINMVCPKAQMQ